MEGTAESVVEGSRWEKAVGLTTKRVVVVAASEDGLRVLVKYDSGTRRVLMTVDELQKKWRKIK